MVSPTESITAKFALASTPSLEETNLNESRLDPLTPAERSERMGRVKGYDTKTERRVREILTKLGYRYRLNYRRLPGRPDIAFPGRRKVIWVHGCYWHRHQGCALARLPKTRLDFWLPKLEGNRIRDSENEIRVRQLGWDVLTVWECQLRDREALQTKLNQFLKHTHEIY